MATPQQLAAFNYSVPGPLAWNPVRNTSFTAVAGNAYLVNTTSGAITVTLPASPSTGNIVQLTDYAGTWATNIVTLALNGGKINGNTSNINLTVNRESVAIVYIDATQGWVPYSGVNASTAPTQTYLKTGSGTYTVPAGATRLFVRMVGAGGGGAGSGSVPGTPGTVASAGTNTTFGSSFLTANAGGGAANYVTNTGTGAGGTGGSATINTGATGVAITGGTGTGGAQIPAGSSVVGAQGASSPFGGAGGGAAANPSSAGTAATTNSGSGGGGAGTGQVSFGGGGGGAGGYIEAYISSPSATYAYSVGAGGAGGTAGTSGAAGGGGGSGVIIITEYY